MVMFAIFAYSLSIGPTTWIYTSEVLPPKGVGLATSVNWLMTYLIAQMCPNFFYNHITSAATFFGIRWVYFLRKIILNLGWIVFDNYFKRN